MGKHYRHIAPADRLKIYRLLFQGLSISEIAHQIGFHRATLYRELARNSCQYGYRPDWASQQALLRCKKLLKLDLNAELKVLVIEKLKAGWSPEQIAGRTQLTNNRRLITHETIYRYIYSPQGQALKLFKCLRQQRRFRYPRVRRRRYQVADSKKLPIKQRNENINQRKVAGHWEGDLVHFRKTKTNLLTLRERKTRLILAIKNASRQAHSTTKALFNYMQNSLDKTIKTLTLDNDPAFALHAQISQNFNAKVYFCEPYKSYQKGGIENANRLLRTKFPKRTNIDKIEQPEIDKIVDSLNDRPMKCLSYATPKEAFFKHFGVNPILIGSRA